MQNTLTGDELADLAEPSARRAREPASRTSHPISDHLPPPISEATARLLGVLGIVAIAVIHILDAAGTYQGTRYVFWLYMVVIVGAIPIALLLLHWRSRLAWVGAAALALGPLAGYLVSRSIGLPGDAADVGNWLDTLGMVSLFVESAVLALSLARLTLPGRSQASGA